MIIVTWPDHTVDIVSDYDQLLDRIGKTQFGGADENILDTLRFRVFNLHNLWIATDDVEAFFKEMARAGIVDLKELDRCSLHENYNTMDTA